MTATDIRQMTVPDKLRLMEALWQDLSRDDSEISSPEWHGEILAERVRLVESGEESFADWEGAKKLLQEELH
jgi:Putative addiction module component